VILIGGDPGIGKSTLALQAAFAIAAHGAGFSTSQANPRTGQDASGARESWHCDAQCPAGSGPWIVAETSLEPLLGLLTQLEPEVLVIDSIQTLSSADLGSAPGSVGQVREVAARLVSSCKGAGIAAFFIGHVTKEGSLAGPRVLEHMVDTVLYFEGDRRHAYRILRAVKNRFGSTNEIRRLRDA
jgi:DNA repair protein RadA/Sms